jgi:hypothetical protein
MNDKEFDKEFSKKLSEEQPFPFDEREWEKLSDRLDAHDRLKVSNENFGRKWRWLLPVLLLLLGGNIWFLTQMNRFQKQNSALVEQLSDIKSILKQHDTIVKKEIQYVHDTTIIYKYLPAVNYDKIAQPPSYSEIKGQEVPVNHVGLNNLIQNTESLQKNESSNNSNNLLQEEINGLRQQINDLTILLEKTQANAIDLNKIKNEKDSLNKALAQIIEASKKEEAKKKEEAPIVQNQEKNAKSNRFFIGINGGLLYYKSKWLNKDNIEISRDEQSWQAGIKAEYALNDRWRLMAGGDYCPYDIRVNWVDSRYNLADVPLDMYPANKFAHKYSAAHQKYIQGFVGLKHLFSGKKWRPYIGIAHTTMKILPFETEFSFQYLLSTNGYIVKKQTPGKTINNLWMLNGGWEWHLTRHIYFLTEGYYYKDMHKNKKTFDQYGLRGAIMVGF